MNEKEIKQEKISETKEDIKKEAMKAEKKALEAAHKAVDELYNLADKAKEKFGSTDKKTRKMIIGGIIGVTALVAGVLGLKKKLECKKKEKE